MKGVEVPHQLAGGARGDNPPRVQESTASYPSVQREHDAYALAEFADSVTEELRALPPVMGSTSPSAGGRAAGRLAYYRLLHEARHGLRRHLRRQLDGEVVSSTRIRAAEGAAWRSEPPAGPPHSLVDNVHYGCLPGLKLGAPTINMRFAPASWCRGTGLRRQGFPDDGESPGCAHRSPAHRSGGDQVSVETSSSTTRATFMIAGSEWVPPLYQA